MQKRKKHNSQLIVGKELINEKKNKKHSLVFQNLQVFDLEAC